jgi:tetratricopeptide (TPR) repeat protein
MDEVIGITSLSNIEEIEIKLEKFINQYPKNKYALFFRAFFSRRNNHFYKAKAYYEELIYQFPDFTEAYINIGNLYSGKFNSPILAKECFEKAIELSPNNASACYNLAYMLLFYEKDYYKAIQLLEECIKLNPHHSRAMNNLGAANSYLGNGSLAESYFLRAIEIDYGFEDAYKNLASLIINNGSDFSLDILSNYYTELFDSLDNSAIVNNFIGYVLYSQFDSPQKSFKYLLRAIEIDPNYGVPYHNISIFLISEPFFDYEKSKHFYEIAISLDKTLKNEKLEGIFNNGSSDLVKKHFDLLRSSYI